MTKIDIISGFLGAGKTTFIKKMLEEVVDESNFVCCIMDLYLSDCKWTEQSVYVF